MENITEATAREVHLTSGDAPCGADACGAAAAVEIGDRRLCIEHFVPVCMQEVETRSAWLKKSPYDANATDAFKKFIAACIEQARNLVDDERIASGQTKNRVQEFLSRISQTALRLRRSPRLTSSVPIILRREDSGRTWEEETWTISVSLHGASLVCRHPVETGGSLVLSRRDRANRVQARVVYCRYNAEGWREIGVELLGRDDFWGLAQATAL